ncbi:hypothetical protein, partial [Klebsiella pneumoniae]|uniref:hypothetical protein n=1 Tax=Klebsiella pneumoniae TaxID=573 RepID=UPI003B5A7C0A
KPWDERERSQMEVLPEVQARLDRIPGLQIFGFNLPSLPGTGSGLPFQFALTTARSTSMIANLPDSSARARMRSATCSSVS